MNPKVTQIVEQVRTLYRRYGIKSVTMDDVAKHLGISKKTLYEHFRDKEELVEAVLLMEHDMNCSYLVNGEQKNANAIEEMFEVYKMISIMFRDHNPSMVYDIRKYYPGLFSRIREIRRGHMHAAMLNNILWGQRENLYRGDLNPEIIVRLHLFRTESLFDSDLFTTEQLSSFALFHEVFVYHIQGILSHEGRAFFEANFDKFKASL